VIKALIAGVAVVGIATQVAWAVSLGYLLVVLIINLTRYLAQLSS